MPLLFILRHPFLICSLILLALPGHCLGSAPVQWLIEADQITRTDQPQTIIARGSVVLRKQEQVLTQPADQPADITNKLWQDLLKEQNHQTRQTPPQAAPPPSPTYITTMTFTADRLSYNIDQSEVAAQGHVTITTRDEQITAESGTINLAQQTGTFYQATLLRSVKDLHLEGAEIHKTGKTSYQISNGWIITCKLGPDAPPPWAFASRETSITTGGYAVLKHATFRIHDIPIFYSPWLMLPAKDQRQTGLLFPEYSSSDRSGLGFNLPLFINLSDSADLTLFPRYLEKRGMMPGLEFRYVLSRRQQGSLMIDALHDQLSDPTETSYYQETGYTHENQDRYWIRGKINHDLSDSLLARIDLDLISDRDYLDEFNSGRTGFTQSNNQFIKQFGRGVENEHNDQRTNRLTMLKLWNTVSLQGQFLAIDDLRTAPSGPSPLWKLPSLGLTGFAHLGKTPYDLDWDANYIHYWREEGIGGQRLDLLPAISGPLPLGSYLESRFEIGLRQTLYAVNSHGDSSWDKSSSPERLLATLHAEIGSTLARTFTLGRSPNGQNLEHTLRPFIHYDLIPEVDQSSLPSFDPVDQIMENNLITYGIDNFFTLFSLDKPLSGHDIGSFKISQQVDLRSEAGSRPLSAITFDLGWQPLAYLDVSYTADLGVYGEGITSYSLEAAASNTRGDYLDLEYRFNEVHNIHQINGAARFQFLDFFSMAYGIEHSLAQDRMISQEISLIYQPACWSVELQSSRTEHDTTIMLIFNLANISNPFGFALPQL